MSSDELILKKTAFRSRLISHLKALDNGQKQVWDLKITQQLKGLQSLLSASHVFCFVSVKHEVDTHELIDWLINQGKDVSIPKIINGNMLAVRFPGWQNLISGKFGIPESGNIEIISSPVDVCITPGTGFSPMGGRLGLGQGYFDRWFSNNTAKLKIAPAYELQVVDDLPVESHDVPVDVIVTENRILRP